MSKITIEDLKKVMSHIDGGDQLSDDILAIVVEEVNSGVEGAVERIYGRVPMPKHPAAYFLIGFAAAGAISWLLK